MSDTKSASMAASSNNFRLSLSLRYQRACSRAEITSVGIAPSNLAAYAIYSSGQITQSWIDIFDMKVQRGCTKTGGPHAVFGPQGNRIATLRDWSVQLAGGVEYHHSSTVLIRDYTTGKTVTELKEARSEPVVWSHDGRFIAAGEGRNRIGMWDVKTGTRVGRVVSHIDNVTHAAFTSDLHIVTLSRDGTLRITNPATMKTISRLEVSSSSNPRALAVSPDGARIVSIWGTTVHIWLPRTNDLTSYNLNTVRRTEGWPLCISPDCRYMACWTEDGFDIMEVSTGSVVFERKEDLLITSGAWSADGSVLALGRMDGVVQVWDVQEIM